jgi:hypothetical protein
VSDASERFLDLATKPLVGNHELQVHARWEISLKLETGLGDELEEASRRLEKSDRSKWKPAWVRLGLILFGVGLLGLSMMIWIPQKQVAAFMLGLQLYSNFPNELDESKVRLGNEVRAKDPLLYTNSLTPSNTLLSTEPVYLATYFQETCQQEQNFANNPSLNLLERVLQVDPENGWWSYSTSSIISPWINMSSTGWMPEDQGYVDLVLRLHHQAAVAPRYDSYKNAIKSRKIRSLPPSSTVSDCFWNYLLTSSFYTGQGKNMSVTHQILPAVIQRIADQKDLPSFKFLLSDWIKLSKAQAEDFNNAQDFDSLSISSRIALKSFLGAARDLKLDNESKALECSLKKLDLVDETIPNGNSIKQANWLHGSHLTFLASPPGDACDIKEPDYLRDRYPVISSERLKPNRRSEHAYVAQLLTLPVGILLLGVIVILYFLRFWNGRICRELSARLTGLFDRSDWIRCLGTGVILPLFYFAVIRYLTPCGGMDWYVTPTRAAGWSRLPTLMDFLVGDNDDFLERARFLLLFLLIVSCSLLVLRQRLRTRMSFLKSPHQKRWIGTGLTIAGFVALPLLGSCYRIEQDRFVRLNISVIYPVLSVMGALLIWLIALTVRYLFGNREQALRHQILSRLLGHTMIWAFALVCCTIPFHMAEERFWVKRDTVLRADPEHAANTRYEWEVIQQMKSEFLEVLTPLEVISH